jgi:8-oxo-dGTP pyrophosphatase MutT (NUDIX family)
LRIVPLRALDLHVEDYEWVWARDNRAAIDRHFARLREQRPQIWNGTALVLNRWGIEHGVLRGVFFRTDYASFLAHRAFGFPDPDAFNCFAGGALRTADGAFLLGVMSPQTANAGRIYFPAGTPDPSDIQEGAKVDLAASVVRELREETGLTPDDVTVTDRWHVALAGSRLALFRDIDAHDGCETLIGRIRRYIAVQPQPELADVISVRSRSDFSPAMPGFIRAYLNAMLPDEAA